MRIMLVLDGINDVNFTLPILIETGNALNNFPSFLNFSTITIPIVCITFKKKHGL